MPPVGYEQHYYAHQPAERIRSRTNPASTEPGALHTDPLEDRPTQRQHRHGRRQRRHQRTAAVNDQPDKERPAAADDVTDLGAGHHEHRHHQAVQRDHGLNRRHRGVEVDDQGTDRHIHHRLIEHHDELGGGQRDHRSPANRRPGRRAQRCGIRGCRIPSLPVPSLGPRPPALASFACRLRPSPTHCSMPRRLHFGDSATPGPRRELFSAAPTPSAPTPTCTPRRARSGRLPRRRFGSSEPASGPIT